MPKEVPNKRHTGEFKQMVVETMLHEKLSYREAAQQFEISGHEQICKWERIYLTKGSEGLYIERRGRGSKGRPATFPKEVEEERHQTKNKTSLVILKANFCIFKNSNPWIILNKS